LARSLPDALPIFSALLERGAMRQPLRGLFQQPADAISPRCHVSQGREEHARALERTDRGQLASHDWAAESKRNTERVMAFRGWHDRIDDQPRLFEQLE